MGHSFSRFVYCDTNILSHFAKTPGLWPRLAEYLIRHDLTLAVGSQVAELADIERLHEPLAMMLTAVPSAVVKPWDALLSEEVAAHPHRRSETLLLYPLNALLLESGGPEKLRDFLSSPALRQARNGQREAAQQLAARHAEVKGNFPPGPDGKYARAQASEFAWMIVVQWLGSAHLEFLKQFSADASKIEAKAFLSVRLFALVLFKYYLAGRDPKRLSDFGDLSHLHAIPYCDIAIMERDLANTLRQIKRHDDTLRSTEIYDVDFLDDWPCPLREAG